MKYCQRQIEIVRQIPNPARGRPPDGAQRLQTHARSRTGPRRLRHCYERAEALAAVESTRPDLVVTDLTMAGRGGIDLIKDLLALYPTLLILVCSMHDETLYAERALRAGAKGYVMKDADGPTFLAAIRRVLGGQLYMSAKLAARVLDAFAGSRQREGQALLEKLSDRELEVFRLFGEGKTAKEIAGQLNLSPKTVSVHRDHIREKLEFHTSAEMIRQAVRYVETEHLGGAAE